MTDRIFQDVMTIATAIIGLAIIAVIVSKSQHRERHHSGRGALGNVIKEAVSPVSGAGGLMSSLSSGSGGF